VKLNSKQFFWGALWLLVALFATSISADEFTFPRPNSAHSISVSASTITRWTVGHYEVLHLNGNVRIQQQSLVASGAEAILWVETPDANAIDVEDNESPNEHKIIAYLENQVVIDLPRSGEAHRATGVATDRIVDERWLGRFFTTATVDLDRGIEPLGDRLPPEIFTRARSMLASGATTSIQPTGFASPQQWVVSPQTGALQQIQPSATQSSNEIPTVTQPLPVADPYQVNRGQLTDGFPGNSDRTINRGFAGTPTQDSGSPFAVQISGRTAGSDLNLKSFTNPQNPNERVSIGVGGFRIMIDSPLLDTLPQFQDDSDRRIVLLADNIVQWNVTHPDGTQSRQFYLEGNVIFAKDRRTIYAERMFYDVDRQRGTILDAEVLTPVPEYQGLVRLKAKVVQQVDANNLQAFGSSFTSSRLGVPSYWLQSDQISLTREPVNRIDANSFSPVLDPATGQRATEEEYFIESNANRVYLAGVPVFAWPRFRTSLSDPSTYLEEFSVGNDQNFGFQVHTGWDLYQLLGRQKPAERTRWIGSLDYLSKRGIGYGTKFGYQRNELFGMPGIISGDYESWFIKDSGLDILGLDRLGLVPEKERRGRIRGRHRHQFEPGYELKAEVGYISDRNFLEQYYEREWDTDKDATTGLWLSRNIGTSSYNLIADYQVNDFFTQTSWLPRFDHFLLGQPLANGRAVWHGHSHAGYARLRAANAPTTAIELAKFDPLPYEADVNGFRAGTRQELDFPMQVGPMKIVPYLLGDITFWQEDITGADLLRAYGQTGIRASLPFWKVDPTIQSTLWNVNGLTHKVSLDMDAFMADASQDIDKLALYDPLDDDAQEHFRRRFAFDTFGIVPGGDIPEQFDARYFALRSGMQSNVTAPSLEIAEDLTLVKFGARQRWQTKRGLPGDERVIDWITFDTQATLFPDADRDNSGADFGMFDYDFRWNVGNRFSLVSDGFFDFFSQGLRTASFGTNYGSPEIGNVYLGYRMIEGPISSNIVTADLTYRMSDKWGLNAGGQVDFGETGAIGQSLSVIYIGESFLWRIGANYDVSRDNFGLRFGFEPRFTTTPRLFRPGGVALAPASSRYLE